MPSDASMPARPGLTQGLRRAVELRGGGTALIDGDKRFTWREVAERVARLSAVLRGLGLPDGGRVVLLSLNTHRSFEAFFGVIHAGGVIVPLNHRLADGELAAQVADSAPDVVILGDDFDRFAGLFREATPLKAVIHAGDGPCSPGMLPYEDELAAAVPAEDAGRSGDDLACLFYTSGTTSAAKGVMLSHANLCANTANVIGELDLGEDAVHLHHGPLFHIAPAARLFSVTHVGGCHVMLPRFTPASVIAEIERARISHATFVPTMFRALADEPSLRSADLSCLRVVSYGAAPMPEALMVEVMDALPHTRFVQSYGMTELAPVVTMLGWRDHLPEARARGLLRSAGRTVLFAEVRVVDAQDNPLPAGQAGEICARGPNVMLGYWNRPELSAEVLRGGWMHTGDIGYFDEAGYLFVVDRLKDMIITGGENVWSQEVENVLAMHPAVSQCAVLGVPHPHWGEAVHAEVTLRDGTAASERELIDHCRERLAHYKCPRTLQIREQPMPMSGASKILKHALRKEWKLANAPAEG